MSLGNVSSPRVAEEHFVRALRYLRRASEVPDYMLAPYLQRLVTHHFGVCFYGADRCGF